ncbi:MAG: S8 family serine peptidase [Deltaproteobacteria bacterium]|nr:S8 family serine peptidase [Deltaproteobacteria bacterium]
MRRRVFIAMLALFCGGAAHAQSSARLLVQTKAGVSATELHALFGAHGLSRVQRIRRIRLHVLAAAPARLAEIEAVLHADPRIAFVERDRAIAPAMRPTDPVFSQQYHLARIDCLAAWDITIGSATAPIAILDSGVDATHPDLVGKLVLGFNLYDHSSDTHDVSGHGTMVAGIAAAASNNGIGVSGVAWANPIMPIRVTDEDGLAYLSTIASGLVWAADHGARVANLSFAVFGAQSINVAAQYFAAKGGVTFAAAGNDGFTHDDAANPWVISVAATDQSDRIATFSSSGAYVDLAAPGVMIATTAMGGGYATVSGTSFASPVAAGVAALVRSVNPSLTSTQVTDLLKANAVDVGDAGYDSHAGWGRVDALNAVAAARALVPPQDSVRTKSRRLRQRHTTLSDGEL